MPSDHFESDTPPEQIPSFRFSEDARIEGKRILYKTEELLTLAARHLAGQREAKRQMRAVTEVERGDVIRAAEILFTPEPDRLLP